MPKKSKVDMSDVAPLLIIAGLVFAAACGFTTRRLFESGVIGFAVFPPIFAYLSYVMIVQGVLDLTPPRKD